jgi:hypothetical protein
MGLSLQLTNNGHVGVTEIPYVYLSIKSPVNALTFNGEKNVVFIL